MKKGSSGTKKTNNRARQKAVPIAVTIPSRGVAPQSGFYKSVADILRAARANVYRAANFAMVEAYWNVGRAIVEEEQRGRERAQYGDALLKNLSAKLGVEFGK